MTYRPIATFNYTRKMKAVRPNNVRTFGLKGREVKAVSKDGLSLQIIDAPKALIPEIKAIQAAGGKLVPYKDRLRIVKGKKPEGARERAKKEGLTTIRTKKWGKISYPKGSKPLVIETHAAGQKEAADTIVCGYKSQDELEKLRDELVSQGAQQLQQDQQIEIVLNFPKTRRKAMNAKVQGQQPLLPRVIHHPAWPPQENLVREIKEEFRKNPNRKIASDLEAMAYFSTASMAAPLNDQGCRIYFYLFRRYLKEKGWKNFKAMPWLDDYKTLPDYDRRELNKMKRWISNQQQKDLKERRKRLKEE